MALLPAPPSRLRHREGVCMNWIVLPSSPNSYIGKIDDPAEREPVAVDQAEHLAERCARLPAKPRGIARLAQTKKTASPLATPARSATGALAPPREELRPAAPLGSRIVDDVAEAADADLLGELDHVVEEAAATASRHPAPAGRGPRSRS